MSASPVRAVRPHARRSLAPSGRGAVTFTTFLALAGVLLAHTATLRDMGEIWLQMSTYAHGVLIFPISVYLIWRARERLSRVPLQPGPGGLIALSFLSSVWVMADAVDVRVLEHAVVVAMVPATIWAVAGAYSVRAMAFPLAYLAFAVPAGEMLVPALMEFTAEFTFRALRLSAIPVYREGLLISIPGGDFEIVRACSGIRYLIASLALGTLFAYLNYATLTRRLAFVALATLVPLLANGMRAYGIAVLAHLSDMRLAVGVDHLLYGWVFFGMVMAGMFLLGGRFRERHAAHSARRVPRGEQMADAVALSAAKLGGAALGAVAIVAAGPLMARWLDTLG